MQQHNGARMGAGQKLCKRLLGAGLAFLVPIYIGKAPENGSIAQLFRPGKVLVAELSLRRAVEFRHRLAGGLVIKRFGALQLLRELLFTLCGHVGVVVGVVAHGVPFGRHAAHKGRVFFYVGRHHKKCAGGIVLFQCVQNSRHVPVFIAAVKCQVKPFFASTSAVIGTVLCKLFGRKVWHRRFALAALE